MKDFLELVRVISWPVVVIAGLAAFYNPLSEFLRELSHRATKISAFHFEVEFPALAEAQVGSLTAEIRELRQANEFSSSVMALLDQLRDQKAMDYAVIDLGEGNRWLTSRLFLFAVILQRLRGLRCFVFVATSPQGAERSFVGTAAPEKVRWALARRFPWLERTFATAYKETADSVADPQPLITSASGALDSWPTTQLIQRFLQKIQSATAQEGWVALSKSGTWEHAEWIDKAGVESWMRDVLERSWVTASADRPRADLVKSILRCEGEFVALLEPNERFVRLVDRRSVLEQVAAKE